MKGSVSMIKASTSGLKLFVGREKPFKHFVSRSSALISSTFVGDLEDFVSTGVGNWPDAECSLPGLSSENEALQEDEELKMVRLILSNHGWNICSQNGSYGVELSQPNIIRILDVLYDTSLDAALAFYFFKWSECYIGSSHSIKSLCRMIHILVAGNMSHRAVELILSIVREQGGQDSSHGLVLKLLLETHFDRRVLGTVCSIFVDCYIKEDKVSLAFALTYQMKNLDIFPSIGVCNSLLKAALACQQFDLASDFLEEMLRQGLPLNVSIVNLFIHRHCIQGDFQGGWKLLMDMKHYGIEPDVVVYTVFIDSLCKASRLGEATSLLFKLAWSGTSPDSVLLSSVIDGYCKIGKPEEAVTLLRLFNLKPNIFVFNSFISKLCTDQEIDKASMMFLEMSELGLSPDCVSYTTMIGGYCKVRDMKSALKNFGKMLKAGIKPSVTTYTLLIDSCCKSEHLEMAECLFQRIRTDGLVPDDITYNTLMDGYGKKGHLHKVFELLDMMKSSGISPTVVTYNILTHSLIVRGFINEAKDILYELMRRGFSPDLLSFTNVIDGLSKRENFKEAFMVWFYMGEHHMKPDVVTCSALLNGYCKAHRMEEAKALFFEMLDLGLRPDLILYNTLIHGFCSVGDMDDACNVLSRMIRSCILPNYVTHQALVLGFEKKRAKNPEESAALKLQQVLLEHNMHVDVYKCIDVVQQPIS